MDDYLKFKKDLGKILFVIFSLWIICIVFIQIFFTDSNLDVLRNIAPIYLTVISLIPIGIILFGLWFYLLKPCS